MPRTHVHRIASPLAYLNVVPVDDDAVEAEALDPGLVDVHVVLQGRRVALAQAVHVDDGAQVVQLHRRK